MDTRRISSVLQVGIAAIDAALTSMERPMTVRAKFFVQEIAKTTWGGRVKLNVVCRGEDNKEWASATPSGTIDMTIRNDHAMAQFEPGDEFFVDFTPAPKGREGMDDAPTQGE